MAWPSEQERTNANSRTPCRTKRKTSEAHTGKRVSLVIMRREAEQL